MNCGCQVVYDDVPGVFLGTIVVHCERHSEANVARLERIVDFHRDLLHRLVAREHREANLRAEPADDRPLLRELRGKILDEIRDAKQDPCKSSTAQQTILEWVVEEIDAALAREPKPDAEPCGTCGGHPPVSGLVCICGGTGTQRGEIEGMRQELYRTRAKAAEPCGDAKAWRERAERAVWLTDTSLGTDRAVGVGTLRPLLDEAAAVWAERDRLRGTVDDSWLVQAEKERDRVQADLALHRAALTQVSAKRDEFYERAKAAEKERDELRKDLDNIAAQPMVKWVSADMKEQLAEVTKERDELRKQLAAEQDKLDDLRDELGHLRFIADDSWLLQVEKERDELRKQLEAVTKERDELDTGHFDQHAELLRLKVEIGEKTNAIRVLAKMLAEATR